MNVSRRYTADINDAKDVLQNAYIKIFSKLGDYDSRIGNLDSWLVKIVINEALQHIRKAKQNLIKDRLGDEVFNELSSPEILARLNAEDVMKVVHELPEGYKLIFNMSVVEGFTHKEIAESLNITESTSRSQLTRAKKLLRDLLTNSKKTELC